MSFHDDVERVLREEERKNRRTQTASTKRTARQFEQPTYFAVVYAKLLMRFGKGKSAPIPEGDTPKKKVSFLSIVREDIRKIFTRKKRVKAQKVTDKWDDWKEYFADDERKKMEEP